MNIDINAFRKMCLTAKEISSILGSELECQGYLLADKGSDIISGFYFPEQRGQEARVRSAAFSTIFRDVYESGKYIRGMWHSHGNYGLFHSNTDYEHAKTCLNAMKSLDSQLGSWDYSAEGKALVISSRHAGKKRITFDEAPAGITSVSEILPDTFYSIVINKTTYDDFDTEKYHAVKFKLEEKGKERKNELKAEQTGLFFTGELNETSLAKEFLEEIGNKYSFGGKLLKDAETYKERIELLPPSAGQGEKEEKSSLEAVISNNSTEIKSSEGHFIIASENQLPKVVSIANEILPEQKCVSKEEKLDAILNKKDKKKETTKEKADAKKEDAIILSKPVYGNDEYLNGARELHAFYVRMFCLSMPLYKVNKRHIGADKALIDMFAALSGVFDDGNKPVDESINKPVYEKRLEKLEQICKKLESAGVSGEHYENARKEAARIVKEGAYMEKCPEKAKRLVRKLKKCRKKQKNKEATGVANNA